MNRTTLESSTGQERQTYITLRRTVGFVMLTFPFVLAIGESWLFPNTANPTSSFRFLTSISAYYHTLMGDVLVGAFCVVGFFMIAYKSNKPTVNLITNISGYAALGTALLPTQLSYCDSDLVMATAVACPIREASLTGTDIAHAISTGVLLVCTAVISLCFFTKINEPQDLRNDKHRRNILYKYCGYLLFVCGGALVFGTIIDEFEIWGHKSIFTSYGGTITFEILAFFTFGVAWMTSSNFTFHHQIGVLAPPKSAGDVFNPDHCTICQFSYAVLSRLSAKIQKLRSGIKLS